MANMSARPARLNSLCLIVTAIVATGFLWTIALSASPQLHASVHAHASDMTHQCGVTLLSSGNYQDAPSLPPLASPVLLPGPAPVRVNAPAVQPPFLIVRVLEHAPPIAA